MQCIYYEVIVLNLVTWWYFVPLKECLLLPSHEILEWLCEIKRGCIFYSYFTNEGLDFRADKLFTQGHVANMLENLEIFIVI
jgi:hypothetical protein